MTFLRGIGAFIEDQLPGLLVGLGIAGTLLVVILFFGGVRFGDESACDARVADAVSQVEAEIGPLLFDAVSEVIQLQDDVQLLEARLAACQASHGPSGESGIRMNEVLGAYSDPAGNFYCFPNDD